MKYNYKGREIEILNKDWNCHIKAEKRKIDDDTIKYYLSFSEKQFKELSNQEITDLIHEGTLYEIAGFLGQEYYNAIPEDVILKL